MNISAACFLGAAVCGALLDWVVAGAMYDVAVVGAGLIGSATAKYLAKKGLKVDT